MNYEQCRRQALSDLAEYKYLKSSITVLQSRIQMLRSISAEQPNNSMTADNDAFNDPYQLQIKLFRETVRKNKAKVNSIEYALSTLSEKDRENLTGFYINRYRNSVRDMARKEYTDRSTLYRRAQRSMDKYILAYFGIAPPRKR